MMAVSPFTLDGTAGHSGFHVAQIVTGITLRADAHNYVLTQVLLEVNI